MKVSSYIPTIALDNIKTKKQRSFLSIISIMLSVAIIFVSFTLFNVLFKYSKGNNVDTLNNFHYFLESQQLEYDPYYYHVDIDLVYGMYGYYNEDFYSIHGLKIEDEPSFFSVEGDLPKNQNEIIVPKNFDLNIGDNVTLNYQYLSQDEGKYYNEMIIDLDNISEIVTYKVVGIYEAGTQLFDYSDGVSIIYTNDTLDYQSAYLYVYDYAIQNSKSLSNVSDLFEIDTNKIMINNDQISADSIVAYLQDTTTLLVMFIIIVIIAVLMSVVSIYNVLIVNDRDRRKEIGLLKSIGTTTFELKFLVVFELFILGVIGAVLGLVLGVTISYLVLNIISTKLVMVISFSMILNPIIIIGSSVMGILLMIISGYLLYRHYFYSNAISDLKGNVVHYDAPYNQNRFSITSVTWRLFVIYNERIKKQTKNLRRSIFFMLLTITLFTGIALSNLIFRINYGDIENDFELSQNAMYLSSRNMYTDLTNNLYDMYDYNVIEMDKLAVQRRALGLSIYADTSLFGSLYQRERGLSSPLEFEGTTTNNEIHKALILEDRQLEELEKYQVYGDVRQLSENGVVLIVDSFPHFKTDANIINQVNKTYDIYIKAMSSTNESYVHYQIESIIMLPKDYDLKMNDFDNTLFVLGFTLDNYQDALGLENTNLSYKTYIDIKNPDQKEVAQTLFTDTLNENGMFGMIELTNYLQIKEDGRVAVFMIEILLYPLLLMLVIIGSININNVLKGNLHIKRNDFSIMKSVGITTSQLKSIMVNEYLENYINAGFITFLLCFPIYFIEKYVSVASIFKLADNFIGMMIISFCVITPVVLVLLVLNSMRELVKINAVEHMNDAK